VLILAGFRVIDAKMPQITTLDVIVRYRRSDVFPEQDFRRLVSEVDLDPSGVGHKLTEGGEVVELSATLRGRGLGRVNPETLSDRLCQDGRVVGFEVMPRDD
jgi:putative Mg2+ transporter-C (MgtC) family protein